MEKLQSKKNLYIHFLFKTNGFFIEAGAWDGEQLSNSIFLEVNINYWNHLNHLVKASYLGEEFSVREPESGLLVEPNLGAYDLLVAKKRNAYSINSCLATKW